jgi:hypothetical protein
MGERPLVRSSLAFRGFWRPRGLCRVRRHRNPGPTFSARRISQATGIPVANILLGDAHNHAAPSPDTEAKTEWDRRFAERAKEAAQQAVTKLQPVRIATGTGRSRIALNRRQVKTAHTDSPLTFDEMTPASRFASTRPTTRFGSTNLVVRCGWGANPMGPIDDAVQIVRLDTAARQPLAVMIHYAYHGTSLWGTEQQDFSRMDGTHARVRRKAVFGVGGHLLARSRRRYQPSLLVVSAETWIISKLPGRSAGRQGVRSSGCTASSRPSPWSDGRFKSKQPTSFCRAAMRSYIRISPPPP